MSKTDDQANETTEKIKKSPIGVILAVFALLAIIVVIGLANNAKTTTSDPTKATNQEQAKPASAETENSVDANQTTGIVEIEAQATSIEFDLEKASTPRILGDPDAPIKISEHSSFTCGACAMFHKDNFKRIKKEYVDTGKAYIVFDDYPRNMFDVKIGAVARCVPESAYFNFVQLLFETQKTWLNDDYVTYLTQNAKLTGANHAQIQNCLNSKELHKALAQRQEEATKKHNVKSTPTLVINDSVVISGLSPYQAIKEALDAELAKTAE
ncbi:MAG: hypothetical protein COA45_02425 [Zetaproteobacteria bacterium]|nr:MAG: hypothetical protein COA45_02425 [Zetaproteobacteria bacterium]